MDDTKENGKETLNKFLFGVDANCYMCVSKRSNKRKHIGHCSDLNSFSESSKILLKISIKRPWDAKVTCTLSTSL